MPHQEGRTISLGTKLLSGFVFIVLLLGVLGVVFINTLNLTGTAFSLIDHRFGDIETLNKLLRTEQEEHEALMAYMITGDEKWVDAFNNAVTAFDTTVVEARNGVDNSRIFNAIRLYEQSNLHVRDVAFLIMNRLQEGEAALANEIYINEYVSSSANSDALFNELVNGIRSEMTTLVQESRAALLFGGNTFVVSVITLVIFIGAFAFYLTLSITRSIEHLHVTVDAIIDGNLSKRANIESHDEIGELAGAFNDMTSKLQSSYRNIKHEVEVKTRKLKDTLDQVEDKNHELQRSKTALVDAMNHLEQEKARLGEAKAKDEAILSSIGDGLVVINPTGEVTLANESTVQLLGYSMRDLIGNTFTNIVSIVSEKGEAIPPEQHPIHHIMSGEGRFSTRDIAFTRKDGSVFPVSVTVTAIEGVDGMIGAVIIFRDITIEKDIDRAKSEFVSLASHQLRGPLTAMKWYIELLEKDGDLSDEQRDYLHDLGENTTYMIDLVRALLNVSRLDLGTFAIEPTLADMRDIAHTVLDQVKVEAKENSIVLKTEFDKVLPKVRVDEKLMGIVFQNLLSNAVKYSHENGEVAMKIHEAGSDVLISVQDQGYGIPSEEQHKIFSKLYRATNVQRAQIDGNGLGLYMTKSIVEKSGGRIWFESKEGEGTTFFVAIPLEGMKEREGSKRLTG